MKPAYFFLLGIALFLSSCSADTDLLGDDPYAVFGLSEGEDKVAVCHYDMETDTYETLYLPESDIQPHLDHGDDLRKCVE